MIHTLLVDAETTLPELKKLFRKKLMTGGGVIRLRPELTEAEHDKIFEHFSVDADAENIQGLVLTELAREPHLGTKLTQQLVATDNRTVDCALYERGDLGEETRAILANRLPKTFIERMNLTLLTKRLAGLGQLELQEWLTTHQGEEAEAVLARRALARVRPLPESLLQDLLQDRDPVVRFDAKG